MNVTFVIFCEECEMRVIYKKPETVLKQSQVIFLYLSFITAIEGLYFARTGNGCVPVYMNDSHDRITKR